MSGAGRPLRYLRFPFNHTATRGKAEGRGRFSETGGLKLPLHIDTPTLSLPRFTAMPTEDDAIAGAAPAYLEYTRQETSTTQPAPADFRHEIPHVMLLHANG